VPSGSASCPGDDIERCWFSPYLPDVNWEELHAAEADGRGRRCAGSLPFDGLRIDAVPMMPRGASRAMREPAMRVASGKFRISSRSQIFAGPGAYDTSATTLGPFGLSSTFHFPLFWALRGAFADETAPLSGVTDALANGEKAWGTSGRLRLQRSSETTTSRAWPPSPKAQARIASRWRPSPPMRAPGHVSAVRSLHFTHSRVTRCFTKATSSASRNGEPAIITMRIFLVTYCSSICRSYFRDFAYKPDHVRPSTLLMVLGVFIDFL
jgi:hypothetical protein